MGYAGYVSAKLPPAKPTGIEAAVQAVKCVETLTVMGKLLYNCAVSPKEEKFRRIKLTNKKIAETIGATAGAIDALLALGWEYEEQDAQELVIRQGTYFTMKEVRIVEDAKERLQRDMRSNSSKNLAAMVTVQA